MPIDLHPSCIDRLRERLPQALSSITIMANRYVDYNSTSALTNIESVLPDHGNGRDQLERAIGWAPFSTFVIDRIHRTLAGQPFESQAQTKLNELPLEQPIEELSARFVDEFLTLPWEYAFLYRIPNEAVEMLLPNGRDEFQLAPGLAFVRWTPGQQELFELPHEDEADFALGFFGRPKPAEGGAYLQNIQFGYVPEFGSSPAAEEAERILRATCGLGLAFKVWERGWRSALGGVFGPIQAHVHVWRRTSTGWADHNHRALPTELGEAISTLRVSEKLGEFGPDVTTEWAAKQFGRAHVLYESDEGRAIARACRWLFDSYVGSNELLSFVQATVSAEILLGDKAVSDITGLTELLANRCAYLVGESRAQRNEVLADFRDIYRTRSRIVHRGLDGLDPDDEDRLRRLRWLCNRVIQKELDLLLKD